MLRLEFYLKVTLRTELQIRCYFITLYDCLYNSQIKSTCDICNTVNFNRSKVEMTSRSTIPPQQIRVHITSTGAQQ